MNMFENMIDSCEPACGITFNWSRQGVGFGQFYFYVKDNVIYCDNELMGKEFIKETLAIMVDEAELTCT